MIHKVKTYCLTDIGGTPFYVGCTTKDLQTRKLQHGSEVNKKPDTKKSVKIIELCSIFIIKLLDEVVVECDKPMQAIKLGSKEKEWIYLFEKQGFRLTNEAYNLVNHKKRGENDRMVGRPVKHKIKLSQMNVRFATLQDKAKIKALEVKLRKQHEVK